MPSYARANVRITNENKKTKKQKNKKKIPTRASRSLKWKNKMYKLKRSIGPVIGPCNIQPRSQSISSSFPLEREQEKGREEERPCERGCARFWRRDQSTTR